MTARRTAGFANLRRQASPLLRVALIVIIALLFLAIPFWCAVGGALALTLTALMLEPALAGRGVWKRILAFAVGFAGMIPVVYVMLWAAQHTVGRIAILPALFGSTSVVVAAFLVSLKYLPPTGSTRLTAWLLLGASASLLLGAVLSVVFWDAFAT